MPPWATSPESWAICSGPPSSSDRAGSDDHLPDRMQGRGRQVPGFADRADDGACRIAGDVSRRAAANSELPDLAAAEPAVLFDAGRRYAQIHELAVATHDHCHRHARIELHRLLNVLEPLDGLPVDADDLVAGLDPGRLGGAVRDHLPDLGWRERLAVGHEKQRQHDDCEYEIGQRSGRDDRGALAEPLAMKRYLALGGGQLSDAGRQSRTRVGVAEHLDVTAERDAR